MPVSTIHVPTALLHDERLNDHQRIIYCKLLAASDEDARLPEIQHEQLAKITGYEKITNQRQMWDLVRAGWIGCQRHGRWGNTYTLFDQGDPVE